MQRYTRQELYDLLWSEPTRSLAAKFGVSDVGFKKQISGMEVPAPERGYWARKQAGKATVRTKLAPRGPGMPDSIVLGRPPEHHWRYDPEAELAEPPPIEPVFEEPIESVRERVAKRVGKVARVRDLQSPHGAIRRYLEADEKRRAQQRSSLYTASYYEPYFASGFEQRRFKFLNSLFQGLVRFGARPTIQGDKARDISVGVGICTVNFRLDHPTAKPNRQGEWSTRPGKASVLELVVLGDREGKTVLTRWADVEGRKLEDQLTEIVVGLIVQGEEGYRRGQLEHYRWMLKRRVEAEAEVIKRKAEAERLARERRLKEQREARDALLRHAHAHRDALEIRALVAAVQSLAAANEIDPQPVATWVGWALDVATQLDPLANITTRDGKLWFETAEQS